MEEIHKLNYNLLDIVTEYMSSTHPLIYITGTNDSAIDKISVGVCHRCQWSLFRLVDNGVWFYTDIFNHSFDQKDMLINITDPEFFNIISKLLNKHDNKCIGACE